MYAANGVVDIKQQNVDLKHSTIHVEAADTKARVACAIPINLKTIKMQEDYLQETEEFGHECKF